MGKSGVGRDDVAGSDKFSDDEGGCRASLMGKHFLSQNTTFKLPDNRIIYAQQEDLPFEF